MGPQHRAGSSAPRRPPYLVEGESRRVLESATGSFDEAWLQKFVYEHPHALAQHIAVLLRQEFADERRKVHPPLGHHLLLRALRSPACAAGRCRWPFPFPPRPPRLLSSNFHQSGDITQRG